MSLLQVCICICYYYFLCPDRLSGDVPPHLAQLCCVALGRALIWGIDTTSGTLLIVLGNSTIIYHRDITINTGYI